MSCLPVPSCVLHHYGLQDLAHSLLLSCRVTTFVTQRHTHPTQPQQVAQHQRAAAHLQQLEGVVLVGVTARSGASPQCPRALLTPPQLMVQVGPVCSRHVGTANSHAPLVAVSTEQLCEVGVQSVRRWAVPRPQH